MKNLFIASFAAIIFIAGAVGVAPVAHAVSTEPSCDYAGSAGNQCLGNRGSGYCDAAGICQPTSATGSADAAGMVSSATNAANPIPAAAAETPTAYKPGDTDQYGVVMQKIMSLFAWLVGVAALTLDYSVYYTVVTMGGFVSHLTAVGTTWRVLRDIGNIMLIFGFLAIGITTILNVDWYGGGKKMLPMLLVAAVFLNFSLFFAEAVIDAGNLFATQFYTQINGGNPPGMKSFDPGSSMRLQNEGISNKIMSQLGLQTLYGGVRTNPDVLKGANSWLIGFMGILLFITTAFVLFALSFVLIARFVALIFLIILSPIGFAGLAVPQLKKRADQWWNALFQQTVTAPILLLMLYIALAVITDAQFLTGMCGSGTCAKNGSFGWLGFVSGNDFTGFGSMVLSFIVAMGLLIAVVIQAKNLSAFGAGWATKTAGKLTFGATALGMRSTAGWGLQRASQGFRKMGLSRVPIVGRAVSGVLDKGAKASFDVRGATVNGSNLLKSLPGGGVDAGAAQKGGFREWEKGKTKEREDYAKTLEQTTGKFLGVKYGVGEVGKQKIEEERKKMMERTVEDIEKQNKEEMGALRAKHATEPNKTREQKDKETEDLRKVHNNLLSVQQEEVRVRQQKVEELKRAPQEGYAKGLEAYIDQSKGGFLRGAVNLINPQRNAKAAEKIRNEAKKGKSEKDFDALKEALKKVGTEEKKPEAPAPKPEAPK